MWGIAGRSALICLAFAASAFGAEQNGAGKGSALPAGFVYLREIDPSIRQDMRYATANNFTGKVVDGYASGECILTKPTAIALSRAQKSLAARYPGHVLKVYDCFRPVRAVARFAAWSREKVENDGKAFHNPAIPRSKLFALGYIAAQSGHSRGHVVDLTIVPSDPPSVAEASARAASCAATDKLREVDDSLDMGTAFDCFDARSNTWNATITPEQAKARRMLFEVMQAAGFQNFAKEWWHYSYAPGGATSARDFVVTAKPDAAPAAAPRAVNPAAPSPDAIPAKQ